MELQQGNYYHIYNRSNNNEKLFYSEGNYLFFLKKYRKLTVYSDTFAYCLMPTHFHFLVKIITPNQDPLRRAIGDMLSGYTKAINKQLGRHGNLFQKHTKAKLVTSESQFIVLVHYIHQNPYRAKLVERMEDWQFSSYKDYIGKRNGNIPQKEEVMRHFNSVEDFINQSHLMVNWISVEKAGEKM